MHRVSLAHHHIWSRSSSLPAALWMNLPNPQLFPSITLSVTPLSLSAPSPPLLPCLLNKQIKSIDCHFVNLKLFFFSPPHLSRHLFLEAGTRGSLIFPLWNDSPAELRIHQPPSLFLPSLLSLAIYHTPSHSLSVVSSQPQHQDNIVAGPEAGQEGKAARGMQRGWWVLRLYLLFSLSFWFFFFFALYVHSF